MTIHIPPNIHVYVITIRIVIKRIHISPNMYWYFPDVICSSGVCGVCVLGRGLQGVVLKPSLATLRDIAEVAAGARFRSTTLISSCPVPGIQGLLG